jgi:hypothetical protein
MNKKNATTINNLEKKIDKVKRQKKKKPQLEPIQVSMPNLQHGRDIEVTSPKIN